MKLRGARNEGRGKVWTTLVVALCLTASSALAETVTTSTTPLTLQTTVESYVYSGSSAASWTLPPVSGNQGVAFVLANRAGAAAITLNRAGSDNIWKDGATATSVTINAGTTLTIRNDGTYWTVVQYTYSSLTPATFSTLTLTNPLAVNQGGTGATSAAGAATALGLGTSNSPTFAGLTTTGDVLVGGNIATTAGSNRQFTVNRTAATDYARFIFQSGAAEKYAIGLRGDNGGSGTNNTLTITGNDTDSYPSLLNIVPNGSNYAAYWFGSTTSNAAHWENANGAAVFNEQGNAQDFRVESDTNANMLFVDGTNNRVGIGTNSPTTTLTVNGTATVSAIAMSGAMAVSTNQVFVGLSGQSGGLSYNTPVGVPALQVTQTTSTTTTGAYLRGDGVLNLASGATFTAGAQKSLTESSATSFVQIAVASGTQVGGVIHYTIIANDSTDYQTRAGTVAFSAVNKAGTETGAVGTADETVAVSTGTLTNTFTVDTSPTNAILIQANAVSSLTQTTLAIRYWVEITGPTVTITPQ